MINLNENATRKELLEIAKEMGLKGFSRMKKNELIVLIYGDKEIIINEEINTIELPNESTQQINETLEVVEKLIITEVDEINETQEVTDIIHISKKDLALMELAKRQSELQSINNGIIEISVYEEVKEPTIVETIETIYEKHFTNDPKKGGRKGDLYVAPASCLKPIKEGSKVHRFVQKMMYGATIEDLCEITPNPKSVKVYFSYDLKLKGYGVKQFGETYHIIFPDGVLEPLIAEKAVK
jgi:hypothetical protein